MNSQLVDVTIDLSAYSDEVLAWVRENFYPEEVFYRKEDLLHEWAREQGYGEEE